MRTHQLPNAKVQFPPRMSAGGRAATTVFEYAGTTSLTVTSPITGLRYHFAGPGARLLVDGRDSHLLLTVPKLRAII